jgi:NAD(P)-dependent dehydrogenase (short-subunit alcohol dehydrogenase family)
LSKEVSPKGIRVNSIAPGYIQTDGADGMVKALSEKNGISEEEAMQQTMKSLGGIPLERASETERVLNAGRNVLTGTFPYLRRRRRHPGWPIVAGAVWQTMLPKQL